MMTDRITEEFSMLKKIFANAVLKDGWVHIPDYKLPRNIGWSYEVTEICFQFPPGYPGTAPYGFFTPAEIKINGAPPDNFQSNVQNKPPFPGNWGLFSWTQVEGQWRISSDIHKGSNIVNFVYSFDNRFRMGK